MNFGRSVNPSFVCAVEDIPDMNEFKNLIKKHNKSKGGGHLTIGKKYILGTISNDIGHPENNSFDIFKYLIVHDIYYECVL